MKIIEIQGDLFDCNDNLGHCVSEDLRMGKGIAVSFKEKFGSLDVLKSQCKRVGQVAILFQPPRHIFYLITKPRFFDKPTYPILNECLVSMKEFCVANDVKHLSMPRIGCGLDGLRWTSVRNLICDIFRTTDIRISIYSI